MPTSDDFQFKNLILKNGLVGEAQMEDCLRTLHNYEQAGITKPLSSIVLEKGFMTLKQINAIHYLQGKQDQYIIRGYTILEHIGQGGLGTVYKARQDSMGRIVALKVMFPNLAENPQFLQRFMREGKVCASLEHPNIVKGIDFGESDGIYFFAMEFVDGESLKDRILKRGKIPEKEAAALVLQVSRALKYAEERNLVHRDIKPENILLNKEGVAKLCDLGLAKTIEADASVTHTGIVVGTPHYISPEQGMGVKDLDIRSDIYSLGITFYYMVTGELPYRGDSAVNIIGQHLGAEIPKPREKNPALSEEVEFIISMMMAKKKENRYQTAQELIVDLTRFLRGEKPILQSQSPSARASEMKTTKVAPLLAKALETKNHSNIREAMTETISSQELEIASGKQQDSSAVVEEWKIISAPSGESAPSQIPAENQRKSSTDMPTSHKFVQKLEEKVSPTRKKSRLRQLVVILFIFAVLAGAYKVRQIVIEKKAYGTSGIAVFMRKILGGEETPKENRPITIEIEKYTQGQSLRTFREEFQKEALHIESLRKPISTSDAMRNTIKIPVGTMAGQTVDCYVDRYLVTKEEYRRFCEATNHSLPPSANTLDLESPMVDISYYDACLYATWLGKRLPTEIEWQHASLNVDFQHKSGIWEWTASFYGKGEMDQLVRMKGVWEGRGYFPTYRSGEIGFRCAVDIPEEKQD